MASAEGVCGSCPLDGEHDEDPGRGRLCLPLAEFPFTLEHGKTHIEVGSLEELPERFLEFTEEAFRDKNGRTHRLHVLPFTRAIMDGKKRGICPHSWPIEPWERAIIEQIVADTAGMQPRFWYNNRPWLLQPAIYCECHIAVTEARKVADDWEESRKERPKGAGTHGL